MKVRFSYSMSELPISLQKLGYSPRVELHLLKEATYIVYGVSIWKDVVHYLIIPSDLSLPNWLPADLFEIVDPSLPREWFFSYQGSNNSSEVTMKMGYREMVMDENHDIDLIERKENAIKTFLLRKEEIEDQE